jgi:Zn ribbon nucleic-acid-binding protein
MTIRLTVCPVCNHAYEGNWTRKQLERICVKCGHRWNVMLPPKDSRSG